MTFPFFAIATNYEEQSGSGRPPYSAGSVLRFAVLGIEAVDRVLIGPGRLRFLAPNAVFVMIAPAPLIIRFTTDKKAYGIV